VIFLSEHNQAKFIEHTIGKGCLIISQAGLKNNCVNANNPEKHTKAKNAAKQGNAGERPNAAARYTVKSSGANSLLFILHRYLPADKLRGFGAEPRIDSRLQIYPKNKS
jgi:hypothetical protein